MKKQKKKKKQKKIKKRRIFYLIYENACSKKTDSGTVSPEIDIPFLGPSNFDFRILNL